MSLVGARLIEPRFITKGLVSAGGMGGTPARQRFFRFNEGTTDYIDLPEYSALSGDVIEFGLLAPSAVLGVTELIIEGANNDSTRLTMGLSSSGNFLIDFNWIGSLFIDGVNVAVNSAYPVDGRLHHMKIITNINSDGRSITRLCASRFGGLSYRGVMANFKITRLGTSIRSYAIDDNSNTIKESVGGFDGTVVNGNTGDWGLFKEISGGWKGQGLAVPPWDSVDQELLNA